MGEGRAGRGGEEGEEEGSEEGAAEDEGCPEPDAEGVWSPDIELSFQEALAIYPPCGRRKIILSDEGKMYGESLHPAHRCCPHNRPCIHIQVLARRKSREIQSKLKDQVAKDKALQSLSAMSSAQLIAAPVLAPPTPPNPGPHVSQGGLEVAKWLICPPLSSSSIPPGYDSSPPGGLSPSPGTCSSPGWQGRVLGTPRLQLVEFSAFVEVPDGVQRHLFVHISQDSSGAGDTPLESVDVRQIYDKFPEKKGGLRELYERGPPNAFFLVKFWADLNSGQSEEPGRFYGVTSLYESPEDMTVTCSSKVCSFGKQVVEKVETERARPENGRFVFQLRRSPMCEYLVNFVHKLQQLPERYMMNSVLENFTILQVVTNRDTQELLLCTAYVFEVSTSEHGAQHHIYRLIKD
uniref:TEA domain transcription factor 2 n=1 Tax=Ornithorhynchus anatinus TaxID=9258 RepID=A0A6I8N6V8_ORNAN